ncbi:barnase inhibitor [Streptomyces sp. NPDC085665]|uniref:barnase inhibitor n=1 Tax=Streptomyces sp. NPDC085665 TaxID=3365735 RepID=UPI0037D86CEE
MAAFTPASEPDLDFRLVTNTFVTLFWRRNLLEECTAWLDEHGYQLTSYAAYGIDPEATGLVLVFTDFDVFAAARPQSAQIILDIAADNARRAALFGRRVMCLVHSSNAQIEFAPVSAMPIMWNGAEQPDASRRAG